MCGQLPLWLLAGLWFDWLWLDLDFVVEVVVEDEDELPLAALAIAAPPPTTAKTASVARPSRSRWCIGVPPFSLLESLEIE
jgi:hypothetical protein